MFLSMNLSHRPHHKFIRLKELYLSLGQPKVLMLISSMLLHGTLLPNALNDCSAEHDGARITTRIFTSLEKNWLHIK